MAVADHAPGTAFRDVKGKLFPTVGMKKAGEHILVNFGQSPFVFDIDGMMSVSRDFTLSGSQSLGIILSLPSNNDPSLLESDSSASAFQILRRLIAAWDGPLEVLRVLIAKQGAFISPAQAIILANEQIAAQRRVEFHAQG